MQCYKTILDCVPVTLCLSIVSACSLCSVLTFDQHTYCIVSCENTNKIKTLQRKEYTDNFTSQNQAFSLRCGIVVLFTIIFRKTHAPYQKRPPLSSSSHKWLHIIKLSCLETKNRKNRTVKRSLCVWIPGFECSCVVFYLEIVPRCVSSCFSVRPVCFCIWVLILFNRNI